MATTGAVARRLDRMLDVEAFRDDSHNGLQVANSGRLDRVVCGVDASMPLFEEAARRGAGLVVCHHGLSWGDSLKRITGLNYKRVGFLLRHDIALYACHLPLDAHPVLGNNARMAKALGVVKLAPFGVYHGRTLGVRGALPRATTLAAFRRRVGKVVSPAVRALEFGPARVKTVGIVSGGAASGVSEAAEAGLDVYLTGEPSLAGVVAAEDLGMNVLFGGHYATERFGPAALAGWIRTAFRVDAEFVDLDVPY